MGCRRWFMGAVRAEVLKRGFKCPDGYPNPRAVQHILDNVLQPQGCLPPKNEAGHFDYGLVAVHKAADWIIQQRKRKLVSA